MNNVESFSNTAKSLARNPLGIIALFIVLIYGFAAQVTLFANSYNTCEKLPLIYFLVLFPLIVFIGFIWLVINHNNKLYGPGDFKSDSSFLSSLNFKKPPPINPQLTNNLKSSEIIIESNNNIENLNVTKISNESNNKNEIVRLETDGWSLTVKGMNEKEPDKKIKYFQESVEKYRKCIELDKNNSNYWHGLGVALLILKDYEESNESFNRAYAIDQTNFAILFNLALTYYYLENYKLAKRYYLKAIELNKNSRDLNYNLCLTFEALNELDNANYYLSEAIRIDNNFAMAYFRKGIIYLKLNSYFEAKINFEKAYSIDKNIPDINKWIEKAANNIGR